MLMDIDYLSDNILLYSCRMWKHIWDVELLKRHFSDIKRLFKVRKVLFVLHSNICCASNTSIIWQKFILIRYVVFAFFYIFDQNFYEMIVEWGTCGYRHKVWVLNPLFGMFMAKGHYFLFLKDFGFVGALFWTWVGLAKWAWGILEL